MNTSLFPTGGDRKALDVVRACAEQATEIDRFFAAKVKEVEGIDITEVPAGPPPQTAGEWVDTAVAERRRGIAFCAPLAPEQEDRTRAWAKETFGSDGVTTSMRVFNQNVQVVTLTETPQETPYGDDTGQRWCRGGSCPYKPSGGVSGNGASNGDAMRLTWW